MTADAKCLISSNKSTFSIKTTSGIEILSSY